MFKNITVIGSGLMGSGIAQVAAQAKYAVTLVDTTNEILEKAKGAIEKGLKNVIRKRHAYSEKEGASFLKETLHNVSYNTSIANAVQNADLIIEAVPENLRLKRDVLQQVEKSCNLGDAVIATNTSSLCLADISRDSNCPTNFAGLHFFNPVPSMKLVEVVRTNKTKDAVFRRLLDFTETLGKTPVACKDTPGFIVNRLLIPYVFQAIKMLETGDASMKDIDTAMKLGAGYPMGPFELMDYIGLDTVKFIQDGWHQKHPEDSLFNPSESLNNLVANGKLGRKTGEGFYRYSF